MNSEDNECLEDMAPAMIRQRHKLTLINTTNSALNAFSRFKALWGNYYKKATRDIFRDYFKGVKAINKKNPIYLEMPKLVAVGKDNGQIKKQYDGQKLEDAEIEIHSQLDSVNSEKIDLPANELIEDK